MIKVNELRSGNFVIDPSDGNEKETSIYQMGKHQVDDTNTNYLPIPLNMELLQNKCGFIDYANNGWGCRLYINGTDELFFGIQDKTLRYQTRGSGFTRNFNIKYLHQLQNLYFVLTGEELEVGSNGI